MTIGIVFKNGYELKVKCDNLETTRSNITGRITNMNFSGIKENKPLDVDFEEVQCIYRVLRDE